MTPAQLPCRLRCCVPHETVSPTVTHDQLPAMSALLAASILPGQSVTVTVTNAQAQRMADRLSAMRRAKA